MKHLFAAASLALILSAGSASADNAMATMAPEIVSQDAAQAADDGIVVPIMTMIFFLMAAK